MSKNKIIGYVIWEHDNDSYMLSDKKGNPLPNLNRCPQCGELLDRDVPTDHFKLNRKYDYSATYDGYTICSLRFKKFYDANNFKGLTFKPIANLKGYYIVESTNVLEFDYKKGEVVFSNKKICCQRYEYIIVPGPACFINPQIEDNTFYRTDLEFGSGDDKSPLLITSANVVKLLKKEKFSKVDFEKILE